MKKISLLPIACLAMTICANYQPDRQQFVATWAQMQEHYAQWDATQKTTLYINPFWQQKRERIVSLLRGQPAPDYLTHPVLLETMVRTGYGMSQYFEEAFLQLFLNARTKKYIDQFKDHTLLAHDIASLNCCANSLVHLFYAANVVQATRQPLQSIIEFGGGFGSLCHIFKQFFGPATIILIDIPEFLALQYLFLKTTLPNQEIVCCHDIAGINFQPGKIHLVPVWHAQDITLEPDLFISTFALSEAPAHVQQMITQKNFFNAGLCYLTGQINGWRQGATQCFEDHSIIFDALPNLYNNLYCRPLHVYAQQQFSYEILAQKRAPL